MRTSIETREPYTCECERSEGERDAFLVTNTDGSKQVCHYCHDCAELAKINWNGTTAAIEVLA